MLKISPTLFMLYSINATIKGCVADCSIKIIRVSSITFTDYMYGIAIQHLGMLCLVFLKLGGPSTSSPNFCHWLKLCKLSTQILTSLYKSHLFTWNWLKMIVANYIILMYIHTYVPWNSKNILGMPAKTNSSQFVHT